MAGKNSGEGGNDPTVQGEPSGQEGQEGQQMVPDITFPPIGEPEPSDPNAAGGGGEDPKYAALERQFEEMKQAQEEERKYYRQTIDRLIQGQQAAQPQQPPQQPSQPPAPDFTNLPDPVDKPQEFQRELGNRFNQSLQQQLQYYQQTTQQQQQSQQSRQQALDNMWNTFQSQYGDLAQKQTLLRGAIAAERAEMQQRGIDPEQGMFMDQNGFMERIASRMRTELGTPGNGGQSSYNGGQDGGQGGQQLQQGGNPPNRTGGLGGGSNYNGKGAGSGDKSVSFSQQLKNRQLNDGLI